MRKTPFGTEMFCIRATARDCPYGTGQGNRKGLPLRNWAGQPQGIAPTELGRATARDCPYRRVRLLIQNTFLALNYSRKMRCMSSLVRLFCESQRAEM